MKKILFISLFISILFADSLMAQYTIPAWNTPVYYRANFREQSKGISFASRTLRGKRVLHIDAHPGNTTPVSCGTVYVYSLDRVCILGPYQLCEGESLVVDIDEREWNVYIESEAHLEVDVWIEELKRN
jgi:hypothetical protein